MNYQDIWSDLKNKWNLEQKDEPIKTAAGIVVFVESGNTPYVLKVFNKYSDEFLSEKVLQHYNSNGSVKLIKKTENAILIERALPGNHLKDLSICGNDESATRHFCDVVRKLHYNNSTLSGFPTISDWGKGFDLYLESKNNQIPKLLVNEAKQVFFKLAESQENPILLHGDLHHDNILLDKKRGWLAIDPKGVIGEPCYEAGAYLRNPAEYPNIYTSKEVILKRINIICELLNYDKKRIIEWSFAQSVLSGIWSVEDKDSPNSTIEIAEKFQSLIHNY